MLRRALPACVLLASIAGGCVGGVDGDGAVARVDDWVLDEARLADLLVLAQPYPLDTVSVEGLVRHWLAVAAFARRAAAGDALGGADAVAMAMWLERTEALLEVERETRLDPVETMPARAAFDAGDVWLLAHVLRRVGPETPPAERELQRRTAQRILERLIAGGTWEQAVAETEDIETRNASGLLGLFGPGELPPALERTARRLEPGHVSSVIESDAGFHILYRPSYDDVADLFASRLRQRHLEELDAAASADVLERRHVRRADGASAVLRRLAEEAWGGLGSDEPIATWDSGTLLEGELARYVAALPFEERARLIDAPEAALRSLVDDVATRELRLEDAERAGLRIDAAVEAELERQHRAEVEYWTDALVPDSGAAVTAGTVHRHVEDLVARRLPGRSIPPLFEAWLLERVTWRLDRARMMSAIAAAEAMLEASAEPEP